jgi:hypothetical protein
MNRHRVITSVLLVLGTLFAFLAILSLWVGRQVLETDNWTKTSSKLLEQPAVRSAVSTYLVDQLYANVNVPEQLQAVLPDRAQQLAGTLAGALRSAANDGANKLLSTSQAQSAWQSANKAAHQQLLRVLKDEGDVVSTKGGVVQLDLKAMLEELEARTGIGGKAASALPESAAAVTILRSDELKTAQNIANALKPIGALMVILMLACYFGAIGLAGGRRRQMLRSAGFGLILAAIGALLVRKAGGVAIVDQLARTEAGKPVAEDVWQIGTSLLVDVAVATLIYGVLFVVAAWVAGPSRLAVRLRALLAPHLRDWRVTYATVAGIVLLVLLWGPTEGTRRVLPALILIALFVFGVEALRRQTAREYPPGSGPPSPSGEASAGDVKFAIPAQKS